MQIKQGVVMAGLQMVMRKALIAADNIWRQNGEELVVTCALDGTHSAGSLHYYGRALDFRSNYFTRQRIADVIVPALRGQLGPDYDVVAETSHIHVEYDPKSNGNAQGAGKHA